MTCCLPQLLIQNSKFSELAFLYQAVKMMFRWTEQRLPGDNSREATPRNNPNQHCLGLRDSLRGRSHGVLS